MMRRFLVTVLRLFTLPRAPRLASGDVQRQAPANVGRHAQTMPRISPENRVTGTDTAAVYLSRADWREIASYLTWSPSMSAVQWRLCEAIRRDLGPGYGIRARSPEWYAERAADHVPWAGYGYLP